MIHKASLIRAGWFREKGKKANSKKTMQRGLSKSEFTVAESANRFTPEPSTLPEVFAEETASLSLEIMLT